MSIFYMMIGLPASGKSTIAKRYAQECNGVIVSTDELRKELLGDENSQDNNELIFKEAEKIIKENIEKGVDVIFDATNISYKKRIDWLNRLKKYNVYRVAVMVATPYEECLERNLKRERVVPEEVITNMYHNFYVPQQYEGFNRIQIVYNSDYTFVFNDLKDIPQDNPHHKLSVLEHCKEAQQYAIQETFNKVNPNEIIRATLLHDIGKLKTKTFINAKGEKTDIAHYYNHEKVSVYDSLFNNDIKKRVEHGRIDSALYIIKLIQWHMLLWLDLSDKSIIKYKRLLGENFWQDLEILHNADKEAH